MSINIGRFTKDPDEKLDYKMDWSAWLGTDTITASTWATTSGVTKDSDSFDSTSATIWLSGGTSGNKYAIENHITTAAGREAERSFDLVVRET